MLRTRNSLLDTETGIGPEPGAGIHELYRSMVDNALQGLVLFENDRIVFANRRAASLSGYSLGELHAIRGADLLFLVHPDDRIVVLEHLDGVDSRPAGDPFEIRAVRKDGGERWFEVYPTSIAADGRRIVQVAFLDVTERRRAVDSLRDREERLRLMFDEARDALFVHHLDQDGNPGRIVEVNDMACRQLGYTRQQLLTMSMSDITPLDQMMRPDDLEKLLREKEVLFETELLTMDQRRIPSEVSARTFLLNGTSMVLSLARDITDRKVAQAALHEKDAVLLQSAKLEAIGRLAGGIAHDFNNILGIITGSCGILDLQVASDSDLREDITEISRAAERAALLTRKLLAFSRKQVLEPTVIDLNDTIGDTHRMLKRLIGEDIELTTFLTADPGYVKVDRGSLEQVIMNLALNARDAMPSGGKLVIETVTMMLHESASAALELPPGQYVVTTVTDTGCGIDPEVLPKVFDPFFTTKERGKGTGLGLSTAYGIVRQSQGAIAVDSAVGKGTSFRIYLPECDEEEAAPASRRASMVPPCGSETVLLAEDEEGLRAVLAKALSRAGYVVLEARNGEDAIRLFEANAEQVALLATDIVMPVMGGQELAIELRRRHPTLPVLFMSGHVERVSPRDLTAIGGSAFLPKPVSIKRLARAVRSLLDGRPPSSK